MSKYDVRYGIMLFPSSEKYHVFRVLGDVIWQIISPKAYNIDTEEIEYIDMGYDDPVTASIICNMLNDEIGDL